MSADPKVINWNWRWGRVQLGLTIYRHRCPATTWRGALPDRWVVHPRFVYDRKVRVGASREGRRA